MSAIRDLVRQIVDYAGLFPPASLNLPTVVENYAAYLEGPYRWMLGRLIIPASRLSEFTEVAGPRLPGTSDAQPWKISALLPSVDAADDAFSRGLEAILQFNKRHSDGMAGRAEVDAVEVNARAPELVERTTEQLPKSWFAYLEVSHEQDPTESIRAIARCGGNARAKIRTGGVTADLIPSVAHVARFVRACADADVGFKATAGLHHPLRSEYRLTYDADSAIATMHGFLNVFICSCFAFVGQSDLDVLEQILNVEEADKFQFTLDEIIWGEHRIGTRQLVAIRQSQATSFGSCSFDEPTSELEELGFGSLTVHQPR